MRSAGSAAREVASFARRGARVVVLVAAVLGSSACGSGDAAPERQCTAHAQCDDGFLCGADGLCRPSVACSGDEGCCPGAVCFSGWCRPTAECLVGEPCPGFGEVCEARAGLAIAGATGPLGDPARAGLCVPAACDALGGCAEPFTCLGGRCVLGVPCDGACGADEVCDVASDRCMPGSCGCASGLPIVSAATFSPLACGPGTYQCECALAPSVPIGRPGVDGRLVPGAGDLPALVSYEPEYGDLVMSRFVDGAGAREDVAVDGVPGGPAVPSAAVGGYRGGVADPGPDRGERPAVAPGGGGASDIWYRDAERQRVMFTRVGADGARLAIGDLPIEGRDVGRYSCLVRRADGRLAGLVFVSADASDSVSQLVRVESRAADPVSAEDWVVSPVLETPLPPRSDAPCGNACGFGEVCVLGPSGEACAGVVDFGASDCGACGAHAVCGDVDGQRACRARVYGRYDADRLPFGEGLYVSCAAEGEAIVAAWYDADRKRAMAGRWPLGVADRVVVDEGAGKDPGRFASIALEGGRVGIAYQDVAQATLVYASAPSWGAPFQRERVPGEDGGSPGVGARLRFVQGEPAIVHLDGRRAQVELAAKHGNCWGRAIVFGGSGFAYPDGLAAGGAMWVAAQALVFDAQLAPRHGPVLAQRALPPCP